LGEGGVECLRQARDLILYQFLREPRPSTVGGGGGDASDLLGFAKIVGQEILERSAEMIFDGFAVRRRRGGICAEFGFQRGKNYLMGQRLTADHAIDLDGLGQPLGNPWGQLPEESGEPYLFVRSDHTRSMLCLAAAKSFLEFDLED
jgi:hypothetical protein